MATSEIKHVNAATVCLTLPLPPSANRYWRHFRGRVVRSTEATAYIAEVGWLCKAAGIEPLTSDVSIVLDVYRARKSGDLDNRAKIILDALQGHAYLDDKQIIEIHARRFDDPLNPRVEVEIGAIE